MVSVNVGTSGGFKRSKAKLHGAGSLIHKYRTREIFISLKKLLYIVKRWKVHIASANRCMKVAAVIVFDWAGWLESHFAFFRQMGQLFPCVGLYGICLEITEGYKTVTFHHICANVIFNSGALHSIVLLRKHSHCPIWSIFAKCDGVVPSSMRRYPL